MKVWKRKSPRFDALHLRFDGLATLVEALIDVYGKQGELIAYDLIIKSRLASSAGAFMSVEDFVADFDATPEHGPNLFTAGLEMETISKAPREIVVHVTECEWARYYQERHPHVGYLMACSTDEVAYRALNDQLMMQRTQTIMEGSMYCDFRIYASERSENA